MLFYSIFFYIFFIVLFFILKKENFVLKSNQLKAILFTSFTIGLIIRIIAAQSIEGFPSDISCFKAWSIAAAENLSDFYSGKFFCDYPPTYIYILAIIGKIAKFLSFTSHFILLIKLPAILADIASSYILYKTAKKLVSDKYGILFSLFYLFNPAVIINSALWGQIDSFFSIFIMLSLLSLVHKKIGLSSALFAVSILMKPQGLIFLPVLFFELVRQRNWKNFLVAFASGIFAAFVIIIPFSRDPLWIFKLIIKTTQGYEYASFNAYNFFSVLGANLKKDSEPLLIFTYNTWGFIFITLITLITGFFLIKNKKLNIIFLVSFFQIAGVFIFSSRMHERYLFPVILLGLMASLFVNDVRLLYISAAFSGTVYLNTYDVLYRMLYLNYPHIPSNDLKLLIFSTINVLLFIYTLKVVIDIVLVDKTVKILDGKEVE